MAEPTQAEIDAVAKAIEYMHPLTISSSRDRARIAIAALDKVRGECVPVDKLMAHIEQSVHESCFGRSDRLMNWISRRGWLDDATPVVQTRERRKP